MVMDLAINEIERRNLLAEPANDVILAQQLWNGIVSDFVWFPRRHEVVICLVTRCIRSLVLTWLIVSAAYRWLVSAGNRGLNFFICVVTLQLSYVHHNTTRNALFDVILCLISNILILESLTIPYESTNRQRLFFYIGCRVLMLWW
jgi:hypothetical protein